MEQKQQHIRYDEFSDQFVSLLAEHWSDVLLIINRQSPRVATTLRIAHPVSMKRMNGAWRIQIMTRRIMKRDDLRSPRDNDVVAQAIRLWAHMSAQFRLPRISIEFV